MRVKDYVPLAMGSMAPSTQRGWATYAREIVERWGERELEDVLSTEIATAAQQIQERAKRRAVSIEGAGARAGFISCCRAVWRRAITDRKCDHNPAAHVELPTRREVRSRRALNNDELARVQGILASGSDPDLALLVFRLCLETGCRRNELLGLHTQSLRLTEYGYTLGLRVGAKNDSGRDLPITDVLAHAIGQLAGTRIGKDWQVERVPLLRNKRGQAITHRWLENAAARIRREEPTLGDPAVVFFTWHVLRHTAATLMERAGGFAAAQYYLGHAASGGSATAVTLTYTKPSQEYLRRCMEAIWEPDRAHERRVTENRRSVMRAYLDSEPGGRMDHHDPPF